jgi:hypothetical protein
MLYIIAHILVDGDGAGIEEDEFSRLCVYKRIYNMRSHTISVYLRCWPLQ